MRSRVLYSLLAFGLIVSVLMHSGAIVGLAFGWFGAPSPPKRSVEPEAVEVAIIMEGPTRLTQGDRDGRLQKSEEDVDPIAQKIAMAEREARAEADAKAASVARAQAAAAAQAKLDAEAREKADADAKADAKAVADARAKAKADADAKVKAKADADAKAKAKAKAKADADAKNKTKTEAEAKSKSELEAQCKFQRELALLDRSVKIPPNCPQLGDPKGQAAKLTASETNLLGSMMKRQVAKCWNINSGADGVSAVKVEVEVRLSADGRISAQPKLSNRGTGPLFADMADSAMRALVQCQPYDLPQHLYKGGWDHMIVEFDPSRMF